jgi:DNA transformation protein
VAVKKEYLDFVLDWLSPLGDISHRAMMGCHVFYCDGVVFAVLAANALYLKADDTTRPRFEARGLAAFRPFADKRASMGYYLAPAEFFEDSEALREWGSAAVAVGRRAQAKRKPTTRRKAVK